MLNYIWLSLIVIGVGVALYGDLRDISSDRYHNGQEISVSISLANPSDAELKQGSQTSCLITIDPAANPSLFPSGATPVLQKCVITAGSGNSGVIRVQVDDATPSQFREIARGQKGGESLAGRIRWSDGTTFPRTGTFLPDEVRFVRMNAVTNDGIIRYAKTAVELAIGLIGIMSLWLGVMKIAEQSGLVARLGRALKPIMTRLFPDVPADHPAMGSMILNISANMLGLTNAATPFGLKAMEELNKLNAKLGTATDAMCTFLVINTSNVQLIPATVIAIRAASGSTNPTEIIGPVILATVVNTIVGVTAVKLLAKLPVFRRQLAQAGAGSTEMSGRR